MFEKDFQLAAALYAATDDDDGTLIMHADFLTFENVLELETVGGVVLSEMISVNFVQSSNAYHPIEATELPIFTEVRLVQFENVLLSIEVTEFGITIDFRLVQ